MEVRRQQRLCQMLWVNPRILFRRNSCENPLDNQRIPT